MNEQSTRWQTGNPPRAGWYIVTSKYRNPKGKEVTDSSPMEWREKGWLEPEEFTSWKQTEAVILAWMPLPEPYRGMGDG